jgi:hypothetical protein
MHVFLVLEIDIQIPRHAYFHNLVHAQTFFRGVVARVNRVTEF